ncbi:hypothetical protein LXL04_015470 [Taraxacum kok-saghyz]
MSIIPSVIGLDMMNYGLKVKNQKIEKAGTFLLHYLIVTLRSQEKERRFLKNSSTGADLKRCERIEGKKSPHVLEKFVFMVWGRNQSQIFDEIEVLKRVVESIGTKLEPLEPKLEIARIGEEGLSRLRTRVVVSHRLKEFQVWFFCITCPMSIIPSVIGLDMMNYSPMLALSEKTNDRMFISDLPTRVWVSGPYLRLVCVYDWIDALRVSLRCQLDVLSDIGGLDELSTEGPTRDDVSRDSVIIPRNVRERYTSTKDKDEQVTLIRRWSRPHETSVPNPTSPPSSFFPTQTNLQLALVVPTAGIRLCHRELGAASEEDREERDYGAVRRNRQDGHRKPPWHSCRLK